MIWRTCLRRCGTACAVARLVCTYLVLRILRHVMPLDRLVRLAWRDPRPVRDRRAEARLLSRIVFATRVLGTSDRDCLQRSLLIYRELSRVGAEPSLVIGFRQTDGRIQGHAWVVSGGVVIA